MEEYRRHSGGPAPYSLWPGIPKPSPQALPVEAVQASSVHLESGRAVDEDVHKVAVSGQADRQRWRDRNAVLGFLLSSTRNHVDDLVVIHVDNPLQRILSCLDDIIEIRGL